MRILVVDDSKTMQLIVKNTLTKMGHKDVSFASSGLEALGLLSKENFDLVLMDWHMPKMNGIDCLKQIRKNPKTRGIPVIMVTMEQSKELVETAFKGGANDYILKPLKATILSGKLRRIFEGATTTVLEQTISPAAKKPSDGEAGDKREDSAAARPFPFHKVGDVMVIELQETAWDLGIRQLNVTIEKLLLEEEKNIRINLDKINVVTTASIGGIIKCVRTCKEKGADLKVFNPSTDVYEILETSSLDHLVVEPPAADPMG